jgi:flagellar biosynthetic protein FliP
MRLWVLILGLIAPLPVSALELALRTGKDGAKLSLGGAPTDAMQAFLLLSAIAVVPAALLLCTSFTRILIVFALLRQALGLQQVPPTPVLVGLSLFLSAFVMAPTLSRMESEAVTPLMKGEIQMQKAFELGQAPLRDFMLTQVRESDLEAFVALSNRPVPATREELPTWVLVPAFVISELKTAFKIGFLIFLPFLVIDLMTASVLTSMGLMMLPPTLFSVPLKLLLFTVVDGWGLVVTQLVRSFQG